MHNSQKISNHKWLYNMTGSCFSQILSNTTNGEWILFPVSEMHPHTWIMARVNGEKLLCQKIKPQDIAKCHHDRKLFQSNTLKHYQPQMIPTSGFWDASTHIEHDQSQRGGESWCVRKLRHCMRHCLTWRMAIMKRWKIWKKNILMHTIFGENLLQFFSVYPLCI